MLKNYLQVAFRNLLRNPGYAFINIAGLAVGTTCVILIGLYVRDEVSFDRQNADAERIVRVHVGERQVQTPTIIAPLFKREFPEVEASARVYPYGTYVSTVIGYEDRKFEERGFYYADSTIFDVLTLPFVAGGPATALNRPRTVVLTQAMATKYFGTEDPIGKFLTVGSANDYEITGVIADLPSTSHLQFDFLGSFVSTRWADREQWGSANFYTYLKLGSTGAIATLPAKIESLIAGTEALQETGFSNKYSLTIHPLLDIRLVFEGRGRFVMLFSAIALLILLVACANYTNLATARAARRAREVGIRKVSGANRGQLARQFFGESAVMTLFALILAVGLAFVFIPVLNEVSGKSIARASLQDWDVNVALVGLAILISLVAGGYPALLLSGFSPSQVLKSSGQSGGGSFGFRRVLVVFQFTVTLFLLTGTFVVYRQLTYMQSKDLGFDKDHVVVLSMADSELRQNYERLKEALLTTAGVRNVSAVHSIPGYQRSGYGMIGEGLEFAEGENQAMLVNGIPVDKDVAEVLNLTFVAGDGFSKSDGYVPETGNYQYIVNEALVRRVGWDPDEAVGKRIDLMSDRDGYIVGVYKNYHYASLHEEIAPQALFIEPSQFAFLMVKVEPGNTAGMLNTLKEVWSRAAPGRPFVYKFLDAEYDALYRADHQTASIIATFALLAAIIACLGLVGLASYAAERRTKEIGVRKAIGASTPQILILLSKDFARLVLISFVIAAPLGYFAMRKWLESFAFRIELSLWIFLAAGLVTVTAALLTVIYQSLKAAQIDPATSLRSE